MRMKRQDESANVSKRRKKQQKARGPDPFTFTDFLLLYFYSDLSLIFGPLCCTVFYALHIGNRDKIAQAERHDHTFNDHRVEIMMLVRRRTTCS